jgi:ribosomal protein L11 methylase PrmA
MDSGAPARASLGSSFRDPAGFLYREGGTLFRQVNPAGARDYDLLMTSGLYKALAGRSLLIPHQEVDRRPSSDVHRILRPETIPYISYPYEWCFSQLRDAALLTLEIQLTSLSFGMTLKDASAFNVQFVGSRPILIDTLSFEQYRDGQPWVAYRQFCQHFLAPLALMAHVDVRLRHLLRSFIDGVPLDLASRLLPARTRLRPGLLAHLHLHAGSQRRHQHRSRAAGQARPALPRSRLIALIESLRGAVRGCRPPRAATEWGDYYDRTNYSSEAMAAKERLVRQMVEDVAEAADLIHDLGANTGRFSRLLAGPGRYVVSHDLDELAVERHYTQNRADGVEGILPLLLDLTNPSPRIGWALEERESALERISRGTVVALALVHHLAISNNVPLDRMAALFHRLANTLIVEFVPKEDSQVQRLLATREDVFPGYTLEAFVEAFSRGFEIVVQQPVPGTSRTLLAMRRKR